MLAWMEEIAPYGIFTTDVELRIRSWNQWLVEHSGRPAHSVLGRPLLDAFPEVAARGLESHFRSALNGENIVLSTALHRHLLALPSVVRDPAVAHMLQTVRIAPLTLGSTVMGTIATIEDVTQREIHAARLQRQQEHDRLLSVSLGHLLESEDPLQAAAEIFPRLAAPLKLESYSNYLVSPDGAELRLHAASGIPAEVRRLIGTLKIGQGLAGQIALRREALLLFNFQSVTEPYASMARETGLRAFLGFPLLLGEQLLGTLSFGSYSRDVIPPDEVDFLRRIAQYLSVALDRAFRDRALRDAQKGLAQHAEMLETKVAERTARLHETIAQLESFSYTIAHDLRAPIRTLKGFSEILLTDYAAQLPDTAESLVRRLLRASNRLDALTRDLLEFSRIARQDVRLEPVDIDELVHDIVMVTPSLQDGVLTVEAPLGVVLAQRTLLQQSLSNLFDNALKFAAAGRPIRIRVRTETVEEGCADAPHLPAGAFNPPVTLAAAPVPAAPGGRRRRIVVEDNGIGIAPESHEKIFGIFERVSGLDNVEGTGIGLAIVARATQQMGGRCGVESALGQGSRFWLELADAAPAASQAPVIATTPSEGSRGAP